MKYFKLKFLTFFLTALLAFGVGWAGEETDVITVQDLGNNIAGFTTYKDFSNISLNTAVYAGNCAGGSNDSPSIQIRTSKPSGIVSTTSGGTIKSVKIFFNSATTNGRVVDVYAKNTAYTSVVNLFSTENQGTKIGSVTKAENALEHTITPTSDYQYIGIRSNNSALYLDKIEIVWEVPDAGEPVIRVDPTSLTINEDGGSFNVTGTNLNDDNVGVTAPDGFSRTTNDQDWGFINQGGSVSGTAYVNYTGRDLVASGTVTAANNQTSASVAVTYRPDIYLYGDLSDNNHDDWGDIADGQMERNGDVYSKTITLNEKGFLLFARKTGETYGWDDNRLFFGPVTDGQNWQYVNDATDDLDLNANVGSQYWPIQLNDAGEYTITIDAAKKTFSISKSAGPVTYVKVTSTDDVTDGNYLIVYEGSNVALDGSLQTLDATGNTQHVDIDNGTITTAAPIYFTYDANAKTMKSASGFFIGHTGTKNTLDQSATNGYVNNISFDSNGNALIINNADNYELKFNKSSGQERFRYFSSGNTQQPIQLYKEYNPNKVATPTFSPAAGTYTEAQTVTISCATDGAIISYSTDGGNTWTEGNTVTVSENMTIQAKATKAGMEDSNVATASYTINLPVSVEKIADLNNLAKDKAFVFTNKAVVVYNDTENHQMWIQDYEPTAGGAMVYGEQTFNANDVLAAGWTGTWTEYGKTNPKKEIVDLIAQTDGIKEPVAMKRTALSESNINEYVLVEDVSISSDMKINLGNRGEVLLYTNKFGLYSDFTPVEGFKYNIKGIVDVFNSTLEIYPLSIELVKQDLTLSFDPASVELYVGETFNAPALKGVPEGATIDVTYSSNNTDVAIVTDNVVSLVKGATGTATITATFAGNDEYNEASATYTITVKAKEAAGLSYGEEPVTVAATYGDTEFTEPELTNAAGLAVTYSTSNDKVATVDEEGNVTIVGAGTATITATTEGDASHAGGSASYTINVAKAEAKVTFSEHEYTVYVNADFTEPTLTTDPEGLEVTYSIEDNDSEIVLFDEEDGTVVVGDKTGTVTITATFAGNDNYKEASDSYTITVKAKEVATLSFDVEGITVYPNAEDFTQPVLTTTPENLTVTYTSTDDNIATVVDGVLMIGDKTGTATITATFAGNDTYGTATASYTVTVEPRPIVVADDRVEFKLYVGQTETKTFDVTGENLKGDITLTLNDETGFYSIEPTTIAMADAENATVTVTYAPTTEDIHEATVTLSTKDAEENVTVTLIGMAEIQPVVAMPTFSLVAGSYTGVQTVTISCATEGATISYSTDGGQTWTVGNTVNVDKDMTIMAKASKDGYTISETATAAYIIDIPEELPTITPFKGYYQIKNNGNGMYANIAGRKTLNFTDAPADKAGTVIWLETNDKGQVQSIRSQAADLQGYANRAMRYVPKIVELVADKLNADGEGNLLGHEGLEKIMEKFNESFDHHLYVEQAGEGWRLYGKTPSMQPVVDFYRENTAQVEAKLPMLESFINSALNKLKEKIGGQSVFTDFSLLDIWEKMGGTLTKPVDEASIMAFYREVLNNKNYVWDFAYQTAMIYVNNVKKHPRWSEVEAELGEYAQYIDKIDQIRPDFKYYVVADGNKPDFISEGNVDIKNNAARTIWTLEDRTDFTVNIPANAETTCDKFQKATTLYTDFAYELPEGVTAYKVTDVVEGTAITEALSGVIPAQTPVLLMAAEAGDKVLTLSTEAGTAVTGNLLVGPDYLINTYKLTTPQVEGIFNMIKEKLGEDFYNTYVKEYEHLMYLNSGTVNNKYFWGLKEEDVKKCTYLDEEGVKDYVVRGLEGNAFVNNKQVKTNKAFLVSEDAQIINLNKRGDVNHDGKVNIKDVTDLIDRLLDPENTVACPICSDFNLSGKVDIKDVTDLIDVLLTAPYAEQENPSTGSQD